MESSRDKAVIASVVGMLAWQALGPKRRGTLWDLLDKFLVAVVEAEEKKRQRDLALRLQSSPLAQAEPAAMRSIQPIVPALSSTNVWAPALAQPAPVVDPDARWREVIVPPATVLIVGKRGSGKSALAYRLLELFRYALTPYVVGVPSQARKLLPEWIGIVPKLEDLPHNSIALVDEAYMLYHSRRSMAEESKAMSQVVNLSRQRNQTLVFVSQEARQIDKNIASSASVVVFKDPGMMQQDFDRPELRKLVAQAQEALTRQPGDKRRWAYVYSPDADFLGLLETQLPNFWKPSLSRLFASGDAPVSAKPVDKLDARQKATRAIELRAKGYSYSQIANELGVTKPTVTNYLRDYPYR